ncbi:MAG TPA: hypothetical protein VFQ12_01465 [Thermoleophilaceae bacterium]|nr:hypothetical protein [Thermoleophilaceae bacterium]
MLVAAGLSLAAPTARAAPEARVLAGAVAAPWPALQTADGAFRGYLHPGPSGRYGEAMLGLGLLQTGLRNDDRGLVLASLRALAYAIRHDPVARTPSVFEEYSLAAAYNLARRRIAGDVYFQAIRPAWVARLRGIVPLFLSRPRGGFFNKHLVEAVTWLQLARSGLRSRVRGAVLRRPRRARATATRYLVRAIPRLTRRSTRGRLRLLADPAPSPLAYHALSLGFYARSLSMLDRRARRRARRTLVGAARASLALAGPDGDVAYTGRSQEQSWALSFTAYGAEVAAAGARARTARALRRLAARALTRLRAAHPVGTAGLALTPSLASAQGSAGLDPYADGGAYAGLTLVGLNWSGGQPHPPPLVLGDGPERGYGIIRGRGGALAVVRARGVWFAVRRRPDPDGDLRSDFGLVALKFRDATGFHDLLRLRPRAFESPGGAGPILLDGPKVRPPEGRRLSAGRRGVTVDVGWARLRWRPASCGVRVGWRGPRDALYEYSAFFPTASAPAQVDPFTVVGGGQRVSASGAATVTLEPGYASGLDSALLRARLRFAADASGRASVTVCHL